VTKEASSEEMASSWLRQGEETGKRGATTYQDLLWGSADWGYRQGWRRKRNGDSGRD
jgi:hypothetical protein